MNSYSVVTTVLLMSTAASLTHRAAAASFGDDAAFLKSHTELIVLSDEKGQAKVAVAPAWQGRVMTSTAGADAGLSFGWINRELIASGKLLPHMNAFGGEDRFWMGPEGGQFSIFFAKGAKFEYADWFTPAVFDTLPFKVVRHSRDQAMFANQFALTNYSGTQFEVAVNREVRLLGKAGCLAEAGREAGGGREPGRLSRRTTRSRMPARRRGRRTPACSRSGFSACSPLRPRPRSSCPSKPGPNPS